MVAIVNTQEKLPEERIVRIWDEPESRIQFLETIMNGHEWEAVIYHPSMNPADPAAGHPLAEMALDLDKRGYKTALGTDENGIPTLQLRHFGGDTKLAAAVADMGLVKGVGHKLVHINQPLGKVMRQTQSVFKQLAGDKARMMGGFYLMGDLILSLSGLGNEKDKAAGGLKALRDPANALETGMGVMATLQSLIFLAFAKEGSQGTLDELMKKADAAEKNGQSLFDDAVWKGGAENRRGLGRLTGVLKDKPLQAGAVSVILGKLSMIGSGGVRLKRAASGQGTPEELAELRQGAIKDIVGSICSITGWSLLLKKAQEVLPGDKLPWNNPKRILQELQRSPNKFASAFLSTASAAGVAASMSKGNKIQMLGNMTGLVGDGIMCVTKNEHYGAEGRGNTEFLAEAANRFIESMPTALGKSEQAAFVKQLSGYLAERSLWDEAKKSNVKPTAETIGEFSRKIEDRINSTLSPVHPKTYEIAGLAAGVLSHFHPEMANGIADGLAAALAEIPSVAVNKDELKAIMLEHAEFDRTPNTNLVAMHEIAKPISSLVFAIPGAGNATSVNRIYEAVDDFIRQDPRNREALEQTVNNEAQQVLEQAPAPDQGHAAALASRQQAQQLAPAR